MRPGRIIVAGASPGCGKTLLITGMMRAFEDMGMPLQAIKPLTFDTTMTGGMNPTQENRDQHWFNQLNGMRVIRGSQCFPDAEALDGNRWQQVVTCMNQAVYPSLIEAEGSVASPWRTQMNKIYEVADMAISMGETALYPVPIILCVSNQPDWYSQALPSMAYLKDRGANILGWVGMEKAQASEGFKTNQLKYSEEVIISQRMGIPHLGTIPYLAPSLFKGDMISMLGKLVEERIDLLPIQKKLTAHQQESTPLFKTEREPLAM